MAVVIGKRVNLRYHALMTEIAIIGGGAGGLAAALAAAREGAHVTVYEASKRIGASILASGNGRCNLSNAGIEAGCYHHASFVDHALTALPPREVLRFFSDLGLLMHEEEDGRLYPRTNKASSVLDVLRFAMDEADIEVVCETAVTSVTPAGDTLLLKFADGTAAFFDRVIVAAGGGVTRSMLPAVYGFAEPQPRLCPLRTEREAVKGLDNIRVRCTATLDTRAAGAMEAPAERGEVLFRDYGVSGIAVFNLSRFARPGDRIVLDLLDDRTQADVKDLLVERVRRFPEREACHQMAGMVLPAVARAVMRRASVDPSRPMPAEAVDAVAGALCGFSLRIEGFESRTFQVHRGGFAVDGFHAETLESKRDRGLFVIGEALDVDGPCGGYNLHWAWTTGILAGRAAAR